RAARSERAGSGQRVVDQMGALQVESARAEITDFDGSVVAEAFLKRQIPLLNVLRWRVGIESCEADSGRWQRARSKHGSAEIESGIEKSGGRSEVVGLLRLWKNVRHVVTLIAPRIHIHWSEEHAIRSVQD